MSYTIQVTNRENGSLIETKDISHINSEYGRQIKLNVFRASFKDEFLLRHKIEIVDSYKQDKTDNKIYNEVKDILQNINQAI